jgi:hypothetical protein
LRFAEAGLAPKDIDAELQKSLNLAAQGKGIDPTVEKRLRGDIAKTRLDTALKVAKIEAEGLSTTKVKLSQLEAIGELTKLELDDLVKKDELEQEGLKFNNDLLSIIQKQVGGIDSINSSWTKQSLFRKN